MLVELLRPAGPELARRWLAALLLVPEGERGAVVASVERRIVEEFAGGEVEAKSTSDVRSAGSKIDVCSSRARSAGEGHAGAG